MKQPLSSQLLARIKELCKEDTEGGLPGWCTIEKAVWLASHIIDEKLINIVEIGVYAGKSLIPIGLALKSLGRGGYALGIDSYELQPQIEGIEDNRHIVWAKDIDFEEKHQIALRTIRSEGVQAHCGIIRCTSDEIAPLIGSLDLLHIDGNHSVLGACRDAEVYGAKVRTGGLIVLDDIEWPTVKPARAMLQAFCEPPREYPPGCGWEVYRKL